jgi:hypothetical protein
MKTLWVIAEDESDIIILRTILERRNIRVRVPTTYVLEGGSGGLSRLVQQAEDYIRLAKAEKEEGDCIVVLHDWDSQSEANRALYEAVERICQKHDVIELVAVDEIEAWLLADKGICDWLNIRHESRDALAKPSEAIDSFIKRRFNQKKRYQGRFKTELLVYLSGENISPSFKAALQKLTDAECL